MPVEVQRAITHDQLPSSTWIAEVIGITLRSHPGEADALDPGSLSPPEPDVCVRLVDEPEARDLNARFRGKDKPTNVLSFPMDAEPAGLESVPLGDIVICVPVVIREAEEQQKTLQDHLTHMLVHGVLHLLGYDHERSDAAMLEMETMERGMLARFGVSDPYRES